MIENQLSNFGIKDNQQMLAEKNGRKNYVKLDWWCVALYYSTVLHLKLDMLVDHT